MPDFDIRSELGLPALSDLLVAAFARLRDAGSPITNFAVGGAWRTLIETALIPVAELFDLVGTVCLQGFLRYSAGAWLRLHGESLGLAPHEPRAAGGRVVFGRAAASGNVVVPARAVVATDVLADGEVLRFVVPASVVLADGENEVEVAVEAEAPGPAYNVGAGAIVAMDPVVPGVDWVENREDWLDTPGSSAESDEAFRQRCLQRWPSLARGATADALRSWVAEVPGVAWCSVDDDFPRGPYTADIYIAAEDGEASSALVEAAQRLVDDRRALCSDILVRATADVPVSLAVLLLLRPDGGDAAALEAAAAEIVKAFFLDTDLAASRAAELRAAFDFAPLGPGEDVSTRAMEARLARLSNHIFEARVAPAGPHDVPVGGLARLAAVAVSSQRREAP